MKFSLKQNPLTYEDLKDFAKCYNLTNPKERKETKCFKKFTYEEIMQRDKVIIDIFWLKDESLEDLENLPPPEVIAAEIVENLQAALEEFTSIYEELSEDK